MKIEDLPKMVDALAEAGFEIAAEYQCRGCPRILPPDAFLCVEGAAGEGGCFLCSTCASTVLREANAAAEAEAVDDSWEGEAGNAIRSERNALINQYLWTVMPGSPLTEACREDWTEWFRLMNRITVDWPNPSGVKYPPQPELAYS